ncbi:Protein phosphatase methylesterase 1 [Neolecta irregularis DAH-3]|uniref:Protein phosphatase methylesterase 1 n=1 Tax=Neolecta irregularis (strain DAH-3) TaxID=1198029 RepID=A0A1U7LGV7_NEOID|nr:Protein phosphatase methylesterase 1 [Neolecta irregularis DAH-3]|eukprot:OLL21858.1 Protein phosphatase methylesterase 1 [Neolecta irregularis DAH-3]
MGGAVVTHVAISNKLPSILAVAVLDVVEGSAIDALGKMSVYLANRPSQFDSLERAIGWHIKSRTLRNPESAQVSVPPLLYPDESNWRWRVDVVQTQPFWEEWFHDLSLKFLSMTCGKLLILAGTDRLDKTLLIGQMQGKFQLSILPEAGHFVHEDEPGKVAQLLMQLWHNYAGLSLPKQL